VLYPLSYGRVKSGFALVYQAPPLRPEPLNGRTAPVLDAPGPIVADPEPLIGDPEPIIVAPEPTIATPASIIACPAPINASTAPVNAAPGTISAASAPINVAPPPISGLPEAIHGPTVPIIGSLCPASGIPRAFRALPPQLSRRRRQTSIQPARLSCAPQLDEPRTLRERTNPAPCVSGSAQPAHARHRKRQEDRRRLPARLRPTRTRDLES
jgi:hypothetical protein